MLVLQIAAGILLAALLWRFWRQSILLAVLGAALIGLIVLALVIGDGGPDIVRMAIGVAAGGVVIRWVVGRIQARSGRAVVMDDSDSPG